mmetsp:Transcript_93236/g.269265  ORF Transcript_93236/g.269265 Transcript_93236/m.269265 type:complete len:317 (+) Transcript_93236:487-1437(+)
MTQPPRRKRRSFGGESGVWFRRKSSGLASKGIATNGEEEASMSLSSKQKSNEMASAEHQKLLSPAVEWDDTLARPVFRRSVCGNQVSSEESDDNFSPERPPSPKKAKINFFAPVRRNIGTKRTKTYGGRSRRPLSLLLSQENAMASGSAKLDDDGAARIHTEEEAADNGGKVVDGPTHTASSASWNVSQSQTSNTSDPFSFKDEENHDAKQPQEPTPQRPTANSSVEHAQKYFAHLDASYQLQLESATQNTPSPHRPLGRTTRKICLSSPGFQDEYRKYSSNSRELGISPLAPAEYAKSRRQFFRKAELFNGFIDS